MSKKIILIIGIFIIIIGGIFTYQGFIREESLDFVLEKVFRGDIYQEVVEVGTVRAGEEINLSFKSMGRIERINVEVGDMVEPGQILVELDTASLFIQLSEAKAALELAKAGLARLLAGASEQEIRIAQTAVVNAEKALFNARQNLEDVKIKANSDLNQAYEDSLTVLDTVYLKLSNVFNTVSVIQRAYFTRADQEGIRVRGNKERIENAINNVKTFIQAAESDSPETIDIALIEAETALSVAADALKIIRDICETPVYRNLVSVSDKSSLDTERANINTALTSIVNSQQIIFSTKLANETNINAAQAKIDSAEGQVQSAKNSLAVKKAEPRQVDIALHQAKINQAQARKALLQEQIQESIIRSPVEGKVIEVFKKRGEIIQPIQPIVSLLPIAQFEIEVDIYEEDVVKVKIGNPAEINLVAFPEEALKGKVISIDPTEKLIDGVVYYETTIAFVQEPPEGAKPGMTADIVIKTAFREDVLIVSEDAIQQRNDKFIVEVFKDGEIQEREIQIGLKGEDNRVEVISGLEEGEQIVIR